MKIIDISQTLEPSMTAYPSLPKYEKKWLRHYDEGADMCASAIKMAVHTGTHVDAPYHYCKSGRKIMDIELERYYGICEVVEVPDDKESIDLEFVSGIKDFEKRVLFKTTNSKYRYNKNFQEDFIYVTGDAAKYLIDKGVVLIGIDYCSIDTRKIKDKEAHHAILDNDGSILEGINLDGVIPKKYILSCLPIKIANSEGSPCRAVLIDL